MDKLKWRLSSNGLNLNDIEWQNGRDLLWQECTARINLRKQPKGISKFSKEIEKQETAKTLSNVNLGHDPRKGTNDL